MVRRITHMEPYDQDGNCAGARVIANDVGPWSTMVIEICDSTGTGTLTFTSVDVGVAAERRCSETAGVWRVVCRGLISARTVSGAPALGGVDTGGGLSPGPLKTSIRST